jgi:hypothetical protein
MAWLDNCPVIIGGRGANPLSGVQEVKYSGACLKGANIPSIQNAQKNLINSKVIPKKFYG